MMRDVRPRERPGSSERQGDVNVAATRGGAVTASAPEEIAAFTQAVHAAGGPVRRGKLVFALDATMSRQPTWDAACAVQGRMFVEAARHGGLAVQLLYYRGFGECRASRFVRDGAALGTLMSKIDCRAGETQIGRVFSHMRKLAGEGLGAFVFIGDALEENPDRLGRLAGELGMLGVRGFFFQEGRERNVEAAYREFARLTGGAYARFDAKAPQALADLLAAVAAFAAGGMTALEAEGGTAGRLLLGQMR